MLILTIEPGISFLSYLYKDLVPFWVSNSLDISAIGTGLLIFFIKLFASVGTESYYASRSAVLHYIYICDQEHEKPVYIYVYHDRLRRIACSLTSLVIRFWVDGSAPAITRRGPAQHNLIM